MSDENGNNWRDPKFHIADIVLRYNEWRKDYFMPPPYQWLDELLGECVRLRTEVERLRDVVRQLTTSLLSRPVGSEQERLPPPPTLTDAERAFLQRERDLLDADDAGDSKDLGIINGMLARLGGAS